MNDSCTSDSPLPPPLAAAISAAQENVTTETKANPEGRPVVLAVENDSRLSEFFRECLTAAGFLVLRADSCAEALALAESGKTPHIDVLLTELDMPSMPGDYLAFWMNRLQPGMKTLLISDLTPKRTFVPVAHLAKPFCASELLGSVRGVCPTVLP